jgi:glycosyltransferase involved in cell wall biosynthesis
MRILIIGVGPEPSTGMQMSGSTRFWLEVCKRWSQKEGCEVHVIAPVGAGISFIYHIYTINIVNLPIIFIDVIGRVLKVFLLNFPYPIGVIFSPSDYLWDVLPSFLLKVNLTRKNLKVKWLASVYHLIPHPSERPGGFRISNILSYVGQRISLKLISRYADIVNTENSFLKDRLADEFKIPSEKIIVASGGIDPQFIDNIKWDGKKVYDACFLARLHRTKGIFDLVDAWKIVIERVKNAKLAIVGSGDQAVVQRLKMRISELNLGENITILGFLSEEDKFRVLKSSNVYVLPSYEEGIPITFYEAMCCGLPVVTYYLPSYIDIKDYIVKVPLGDVKELADQISKMLNDKDFMSRIAEHGRKEASEHTWDKVADCILSRIEAIVHE